MGAVQTELNWNLEPGIKGTCRLHLLCGFYSSLSLVVGFDFVGFSLVVRVDDLGLVVRVDVLGLVVRVDFLGFGFVDLGFRVRDRVARVDEDTRP